MSVEQPKKKRFLDRLAEETGVAMVVLDGEGHEISSSNNNSICRSLMSSDHFRKECAKDCGRAFERAFSSKGPISYVCHAGLACTAVPVQDRGNKFVAIAGRAFLSSENYRKTTERAISGDLSEFPPTEFFSNILMSGSAAPIEKAAESLSKFAYKPENDQILELNTETDIQPPEEDLQKATPEQAIRPGDSELDERISRFVREDAPKAPAYEPSTSLSLDADRADIMSWRSLFGALLEMEYPDACTSVLEFVSTKFEKASLVWLERKDNILRPISALGSLAGRSISVSLETDRGIFEAAASRDEPIELKERRASMDDPQARSLVLFPVQIGSEIRCALGIEGYALDGEKIRELSRIARTVAPQLEILRLRHEVSRREWFNQGVRRLGESLKNVNGEDFWLKVTRVSAELLHAERASLLVHDEISDQLHAKASIGAVVDLRITPDVGNRVAKRVYDQGMPIVARDLSAIGLQAAPSEWRYKTSSFISFPIIFGDRRLAVMNFTDRVGGGSFSQRDLELLQTLSTQIAVVIDNSRLKDRTSLLEQRSITDSLTGLLNRGYIEERLIEEMNRASRYGLPMSLLMLDVDDFKSYNDRFGHPAGDVALKMVAQVLKDTLRAADVAARYGGEEFAILLPQTPESEAAAIAERIRYRVEMTPFPHRAVTVSIGIAGYQTDYREPRDWISAADIALYDAKHMGRNAVRIYDRMGRSFRERIN
jgi:diguanylate cyclase (GGDEF)-like protein